MPPKLEFQKVLVSFFRINDPYRLLGVLVVMLLMALPLWIDPTAKLLNELQQIVLGESINHGHTLYTQLITDTAPMAAWFNSWIEWILGRSITGRHILAFTILFFQVTYFTVLLINNKAHSENTYLPGFIFGILSLFSFDMLSLSNELFASTIMLFVINYVFKEIEFRIQRDDTVLKIGFYCGVASLFVFSYIIFVLGILLMLIIFGRPNVRKLLLLLVGVLLPHSLLIMLYYYKDGLGFLFSHFYAVNFSFPSMEGMTKTSLLFLGAIPVVYFLLSLVMLNRDARQTKYQSQISQVMLVWVILAFIHWMFSASNAPASLITFIPPFSYFISHYILLIRRKRLAEITLWVFLISVSSIMLLSRYGKIKSIDYSALFIKPTKNISIEQKKVLVLADDWGIYEKNKMAGGFLNWKISEPVFKEQDYFQHIMIIDRAFSKDAPDVIIDPDHYMPNVFKHNPELASHYISSGELYLKK